LYSKLDDHVSYVILGTSTVYMSVVKIPSLEGVKSLHEEFGIDVFNDSRMREYLSHESYKRLNGLLKRGEHQIIDVALANDVASAMKNWAVSRGATHYTHWFQPMNGVTAEKHDSFIGHYDPLGRPLLEFNGELLVRGEPDASSFPSGGLRSTSEARGYTLWDPQSPAFLRHGKHGSLLVIPTAFGSWTGEALDHKVPLLKSDELLCKEALRTLRMLGDTEAMRVTTTLGIEQEFFLVSREHFKKRPDLVATGRTLQGRKPPKGQELEDCYFSSIPSKATTMLQDVEIQLWRLGVPLKTRHTEVAPGQHEVAPVFEISSLACDHQMLTMTVLKETAREYGLEALLHEKPFANVNGSGKHNNWAMCTDTGVNLMDPGSELLRNPKTAFEGLGHARFTVFLAAFLKAVDDQAGPLRLSIANHSQDLRLGANEAPPAIMSVYLGEALTSFVDGVIKIDNLPDSADSPKVLRQRALQMNDDIKYVRLPTLRRDRTDRNRTSPMAFTGNKFEFRAVGSSANSCVPCTAMNSAVCLSLRSMNEAAEGLMRSKGFDARQAIQQVAIETLRAHYRIIFDGNGYSEEWVQEAARRGLPNFRTTVQAYENIRMHDLYVRAGVFTDREVDSRVNVALETYTKNKRIEAKAMLNLVDRHIFPSAQKAIERAKKTMDAATGSGITSSVTHLRKRLDELVTLADDMIKGRNDICFELDLHDDDLMKEAKHIDQVLNPLSSSVRKTCDDLEGLVASEDWTIPTYHEMLFLMNN
jgi:glutamine synthetase